MRGIQNWQANRAAQPNAPEDWRAADAARRNQLIAQDDAMLTAMKGVDAQRSAWAASGGVQLDDIVLASGTTQRMPGGGYETTYHDHYVDPYLIARNGGSADYTNTVRAYPVADVEAATVTRLAFGGSGASGGVG